MADGAPKRVLPRPAHSPCSPARSGTFATTGNSTVGIVMIVAGLCSVFGGIYFLKPRETTLPRPTPRPPAVVAVQTDRPAYSLPPIPPNQQPETGGEGFEFEKYVVKKFNKKYFSLKEWRGDKYEAGIYAESSKNPDFEIELLGKTSWRFAVECKWRRTFVKREVDEGIDWANEEQIQNYRRFSADKRHPGLRRPRRRGRPTPPRGLVCGPPGPPERTVRLCEIPLRHSAG